MCAGMLAYVHVCGYALPPFSPALLLLLLPLSPILRACAGYLARGLLGYRLGLGSKTYTWPEADHGPPSTHGWLHSGSVPEEYGNFSSLNKVNMSENALTGTLPASWASTSLAFSLGSVMLDSNRLSGPIPDGALPGLPENVMLW